MLVGRDPERRRIDALVAGARVGQSGVLVLTGEAGIGKTSLLEYAAERAEGVRLLRATGTESEKDVGFGGLQQLLRASVSDLDRIPPPQAQALGVALALRAGLGGDRFAVGAATLSMLTRFSENSPLGLLIDDAQHLDQPSSEAVAFAARRLLADPVFVLVAVRDDEHSVFAAGGFPTLRLTGVDTGATQQLTAAHSPKQATLELSQRLHQVTGGNPLAILEMAGDLARLSALPPDAPAPVPAALAQRFAHRAAALGVHTRKALVLAATAGGDLAVIARACTGTGIDVNALAGAERAGLIRLEQDRVEFIHPLVRSAIYSSASAAERRALHAAVADALPGPAVDRRAWHRCDAALGPDEDVAEAMVGVARRASDRSAYSVAATAYERAARLTPEDAARAGRFLAAGEAAWAGGETDGALALLDEALTCDQSRLLRTVVLQLQGEIATRCGSPAAARDILLGAAREIAQQDPGRALVLLAGAIDACFYLGDATSALSAAKRVDELLVEAPPGLPRTVATMAAGLARVLAGEPGMDQVRAAVEMLISSPEPAVVESRYDWIMVGPLFLRESDTGRQLVRQTVDERRAKVAVGSLPHLLFHVARDEATTDQWAAAEADYAEAIGLARELGQTTELAISLAGLAWLEARQGQEAACLAHLREAVRLSTEHQIHLSRVWADLARGELALGLGRAEEAVATLSLLAGRLAEIGLRDVDLSPAPELTEALLRTGRTREASAAADEFYPRADAKGQPWALARAQRVRGLLCTDEDIDSSFTSALDLHARTLDVFEEARTQLSYGSRLRRARRRVDARIQLRAALRTFERLGARPWAALTTGELRATGESAAGTRDVDRLTPQEMQIALLLGRGQTTREAAAAMFLSPKTVEYHLRHIYTKFEISSRSELAARIKGEVFGSGSESS